MVLKSDNTIPPQFLALVNSLAHSHQLLPDQPHVRRLSPDSSITRRISDPYLASGSSRLVSERRLCGEQMGWQASLASSAANVGASPYTYSHLDASLGLMSSNNRVYMAKRHPCRAEQHSPSQDCLRRSSRLAQKIGTSNQRVRSPCRKQLPSPSPSYTPAQESVHKRRFEIEPSEDAVRDPKRRRTTPNSHLSPPLPSHDPVAHWAKTHHWPLCNMSKLDSGFAPSSKRRSSSTHHSDKRKRLEDSGIYMKSSVLLKEESKKFCKALCSKRQHEPSMFPCYPASTLENVLERVHECNEARLQRDVMPWVVPSAENLHLSGEIDRDYIGEEVDTEWIRCGTMGSTRPKPDFAAGLKQSAFSPSEDNKLRNFSTAQSPYLFTPDLAFPFLMCEAKTGRTGLDNADVQNIHSASIATRAILSLYTSAFGKNHKNTQNLLGRILVFTVSHNSRIVNVYGHYAVSNGTDGSEPFAYFRHDIAMFSLTLYEGKERFKAYNFIKQLYNTFAPRHLERIRGAVRAMPEPFPRTGLSFAASDITLEEGDSQQDSAGTSQGSQAFKAPSEPASALQSREIANMRVQLDTLLHQIDQQREDSKRREEALEQQREESRKREEASREREIALERRLDEMLKCLNKSTK